MIRLVRYSATFLALVLFSVALWFVLSVLLWIALAAIMGEFKGITILAIASEFNRARQTSWCNSKVHT